MTTPLDKVIYRSKIMQQVRKDLVPFIDSAASLLFWGETGSGMGFFARMIHESSSRHGKFLRIPGFSLDEDTVKQQFIGIDDRPGWLEEAHEGTILLKRISEASPAVQHVLVNLLSTQSVDGRIQFSRKGRTEPLTVNVRFIYSMAHDFDTAIQDGLLRHELLDLLNTRGKIIRLPPLRERKKDVPAIIHNFLDEFNAKYSRTIATVDKRAQTIFTNYIWPGNIDELKRTIESIFVQYPTISTITEDHIPENVKQAKLTGIDYSFKLKDEVRFRGKIVSAFLRIQTEKKKLRLNTNDLAEILRVEDTEFVPPKFKHFLFKLKDGSQLTGHILDTRMDIDTPFDADYQINPQEVYSVFLS